MHIRGTTRLCDSFSDYVRTMGMSTGGMSFVVGECGKVPLKCNATANDLGVKDGDSIIVIGGATAAGVAPLDFSSLLGETIDEVNDDDDDDDDDNEVDDVPSIMAAGMTMVGQAVVDLTEGCKIVADGAMVVLVGPGGKGANFRIDRRATPMWAILGNYELFLCNAMLCTIPLDASPLDTLRFVHGGGGCHNIPTRPRVTTAFSTGTLYA